MLGVKRIHIRNYELGLRFRDGEFIGLARPGRHWMFDPLGRHSIDVASLRAPWLVHDKLDLIVKSGALADRAIVLDLKDFERALVWVDGRFSHVLPPGLYAYWTALRDVKVEVVDARNVRFEHPDLPAIAQSACIDKLLEFASVGQHQEGVLSIDGVFAVVLPPGRYAFWKNVAKVELVAQDLREATLDIAGQDIITADKVSLRVNLLVNFRVSNVRLAAAAASDARQALYREAQLALRASVGARDLDALLAGKDSLADGLVQALRPRAGTLGIELISAGVRDVILPGDMKELMNKVTEAKKAAEANLIARREETAAMRSQANTAKLLDEHPTLMRLKELEALEKIAANGKLNVLVGEKGLAERVVNLL